MPAKAGIRAESVIGKDELIQQYYFFLDSGLRRNDVFSNLAQFPEGDVGFLRVYFFSSRTASSQ
jgi:hypothetical protein